jgi:hypothetical protein
MKENPQMITTFTNEIEALDSDAWPQLIHAGQWKLYYGDRTTEVHVYETGIRDKSAVDYALQVAQKELARSGPRIYPGNPDYPNHPQYGYPQNATELQELIDSRTWRADEVLDALDKGCAIFRDGKLDRQGGIDFDGEINHDELEIIRALMPETLLHQSITRHWFNRTIRPILEDATCVLCGDSYLPGSGHNPAPLDSQEAGRCCNDCNANLVGPARIAALMDGDN